MIEIIITVLLILLFFQFLPIVLIISGILNILTGNLLFGIVLLVIGLILND